MQTIQDTPRNQPEREIRFLQELYARLKIKLEEKDRQQPTDSGAKAVFKRAMSGEPNHIWKTYEFLPYIGEKSEWKEKHIWIPVACLSVFYPQPISEVKQRRDFGYSCWSLQKEIQRGSPDAKGVARRFRALLDTSLEDIQTPLTALVRQMKAKEVAIDYPQLLADLRQWEHPNQYIQDRWARAFWGAPLSLSNEAEPATDDIAE
jgi:CRISPR system Cascade subunit CasB